MIIYLDQNKWIELARMTHGKGCQDKAKRVLRDFNSAVEGNRVSLPLSACHYIETSRISNIGRKTRLGATMLAYSKGTTIVGYPAVVRHELEVALSRHIPQIKANELPILGRGHTHAFGTPPLQGRLAALEDDVERSMLTGNEKFGLRPLASNNTQQRKNFCNHLATLHARQMLVPKPMRENWLYTINMIDILGPLNEVLSKHRIPFDVLGGLGPSKLKAVIDDMPSRRVDIHLHKQVLRNPNYKSRESDLEDWASLAMASCYCDVVVCEKHMADMLKRDGFQTKARIEVDLEKTFLLV